MDAEALLNLIDSCWFHYRIFAKQGHLQISKANTDKKSPEDEEISSEKQSQKPKMLRLPSRTMSDQLISQKSFKECSSPLKSGALKTIVSGKEFCADSGEIKKMGTAETGESRGRGNRGSSRRNQTKRLCKSLSELEFEELKGFMDLGFVFSDEDRDSSLVSVIPGLQRLGREREESSGTEENPRRDVDESRVSRPYLSEAWEALERRREKESTPLTNWRILASESEEDVKESLRLWAHTVASAVR